MAQVQSVERVLGIAAEEEEKEEEDIDNPNGSHSSNNTIGQAQTHTSIVRPIIYEANSWGSDHPYINSDGKRIPFTDKEKEILSGLVKAKLRENGRLPDNIAAFLVGRIKRDPALYKYFHPRHLLSSARIRPLLQSLKIVH